VYLTRNEDRRNNLPDIVSFANRVNADIFISIHFNFADNRSICGTETYYYNRSSRRLALILHQALLSGIKRKDRGLRRCMFYAIHHTEMPAVLIEPVYLTNDEEERLAASSYFQQELAEDILRGVKAYFRSKSD
jgi:N-acetylmuramoyl-L-alanine amidase